jgi:3-methyladenine DNA glycosylase AlkD
MKNLLAIKNELQQNANAEKAEHLLKFFQVFPGGYGENDKFIGVSVPNQRKIANKYYKACSLSEVEQLLNESVHEYRLTALFILVYKFEKLKKRVEQKVIVDLYIDNVININNWDLVDSSAYKILGPYFLDKDKSLLYEYANSECIWKQRISIITTFHFIRNKQYIYTLNIAKILLNHTHDLIHKAVGWMLREIGNRAFKVEFNFLKEHYTYMPRTMLRYAIEKFDEDVRQQFLKGKII